MKRWCAQFSKDDLFKVLDINYGLTKVLMLYICSVPHMSMIELLNISNLMISGMDEIYISRCKWKKVIPTSHMHFNLDLLNIVPTMLLPSLILLSGIHDKFECEPIYSMW